MKGKRYTREDEIRILREADTGKSILDVCRELNISEVSFHRWKRPFGQWEVKEARRLKELERENGELKKMLAEALLKNRVLEAVCEKNCKLGASTGTGADDGGGRGVLRACRLPDPAVVTVDELVSWSTAVIGPAATAKAVAGIVGRTSPPRASVDRGVVAPRGLARGQAPAAAVSANGGAAGTADPAQAGGARRLDRVASPSHASRSPIKGSDQDKSSVHWLPQPSVFLLRLNLSPRPESAVRAWVVSYRCFVQSPIWFETAHRTFARSRAALVRGADPENPQYRIVSTSGGSPIHGSSRSDRDVQPSLAGDAGKTGVSRIW
jgi:putative transposase